MRVLSVAGHPALGIDDASIAPQSAALATLESLLLRLRNVLGDTLCEHDIADPLRFEAARSDRQAARGRGRARGDTQAARPETAETDPIPPILLRLEPDGSTGSEALRPVLFAAGHRLDIDLVGGALGYRVADRRHDSIRRERLVRLLARLPSGSEILDASAGMGRDALLLATAGLRVTAYERQPWVWLLLDDARRRLAAVDAERAARLDFVYGDATGPTGATSARIPDSSAVVGASRWSAAIFDPMFPPRRKSAAVRQELRALQRLTHAPADEAINPAINLGSAELAAIERAPAQPLPAERGATPESTDIHAADAGNTLVALLQCAPLVIVKRSPQASPLPGPTPTRQHVERTVRWDVYDQRATSARSA